MRYRLGIAECNGLYSNILQVLTQLGEQLATDTDDGSTIKTWKQTLTGKRSIFVHVQARGGEVGRDQPT